MIGQTVSHYKILEKLGEGGMGVVYKAEDTKLKRLVALKFLPAGVSRSEDDLVRFQREAEAISALNHPNIATIYGMEDFDGKQFLILEYIPGGTLRERLQKLSAEGHQMPISDVLDYGIQIVEALGNPHKHQIVHRDIKSDNIILTAEGAVKVTDFGLAKLENSAQLTQAGGTVGTAAYMSPEQIRGGEIDSRSDLFSLGVVLYELATTQLPFRGDHPAALAYTIVNEEPQSLALIRMDAPPALAGVINKCLAKDVSKRYQKAEEIVSDLRNISRGDSVRVSSFSLSPLLRWSVVALSAALVLGTIYYFLPISRTNPVNNKTIAVLPFSNMSGNADDAYFSDGVMEEILTHLSKISELNVISRTTMMQYRDSKKSLREIGGELNAGAVLEGSVRHAGDKVRITAELIDAASDKHIWTDTYDKDFRDIFAIQSDVAQKIAAALKANLSPSEKRRIEKIPTANTEAYNLYLKGDFFLWKTTEDDLKKGYELMNEAIKLDSNFALPYSGIATYYIIATDFYLAPAVAMPEVKRAATKALEIDGELAQGHAALGFYHFWYSWNWELAREEVKKAVDLGPREYFTHFNYAWYSLSQGNFESALTEGRKCLELEPLRGDENAFYGMELFYARRYDEAFAQLQKSLELDPNFPFTRLFLGWCYLHQGKFAEAIREHRKAHELFASPWSLARLGYAYARAGERKEALAILDSLELQSKHMYVPSDVVASIYVALGNNDRALEYLQKGYEERAGWMAWLKIDPIWDPLRSDPRFTNILKKMELPS